LPHGFIEFNPRHIWPRLILGCTLAFASGTLLAHASTCDWCCSSCGDSFGSDGTPSIPPAVMRLPMSARVEPAGVGRSGFDLSYFQQGDQGQAPQYPLDSQGRVTDLGLSTRWGLPGGVEVGGALDYPFFVPSFMFRAEPFGSTWTFGPLATLEMGMNMMPDYHIGLSLGAGLGRSLDVHGYYQLGVMLGKEYGEWGAGMTMRPSSYNDIEIGAGIRTFWDDPRSPTTARGSLSLVFGNKASVNDEAERAFKLYGDDPQKAYDAGDAQSAAILFRRELGYQPDSAELWQGYGNALKALDRHDEAVRAFAKARALQGRDLDTREDQR
jgi:hypothetical protein